VVQELEAFQTENPAVEQLDTVAKLSWALPENSPTPLQTAMLNDDKLTPEA
jgi:hypothetical protein